MSAPFGRSAAAAGRLGDTIIHVSFAKLELGFKRLVLLLNMFFALTYKRFV